MDPRDHTATWLLMRCTGGTDAWTDPHDDPTTASADRAAAWASAVSLVVVVAALVAILMVEAVRWLV